MVLRRASVVIALAFGAVACGSGMPADTPDTSPDTVGVYVAAIPVSVAGVPLDDGDVVYVTMRDDHKPLALDEQAEIVNALESDLVVRFVDDDDEAVDIGDESRPVAHGVLLRLGVLDQERPTELLVERYRDRAHEDLLVLRVGRSGEIWTAQITSTKPVAP